MFRNEIVCNRCDNHHLAGDSCIPDGWICASQYRDKNGHLCQTCAKLWEQLHKDFLKDKEDFWSNKPTLDTQDVLGLEVYRMNRR
jgi:hypothetical protein